MNNFIKLCKIIIDTNGNPSVQDVLDCGFTMEQFVRLSQPNIKAEHLVKNAREALRARKIYYKEFQEVYYGFRYVFIQSTTL